MVNALNESYYDELMLSHRQPARISHADGYVSLDENGDATFYYYLKDHLGNVRSVLTPDADGKPQVEQANDYFPFGMSFESKLPLLTKSGSGSNKHKYNGKEEQEMPGKWLDYGARLYDPALGRWHVVDPLAFKYMALSPYCYVGNRPTVAIDPDGREIVVVGKNKRQTYNDLAILYATPLGRQLIDVLHKSSTKYKINGGGWFPSSSGYRPFWNKVTYYQKDANVKGNKFRSFEMLGHELFHAYQDELGMIEGNSLFNIEKGAVKFENYLRKIYSDGAGSQRLKYGSEELFNILEPTSYDTGGEKRDASTVKSYVQVNGGLGEFKQGEDIEGAAKQDNTRVVLNVNTFQRIFEYMENNNLQRVTIDF